MKIFYNQEQVKEVLGFTNVNNDLSTIRPYLDQAVDDILLTVSGEALLARLAAKAEDRSFEDGFETDIWGEIEKAIAHYAYFLYVDDGSVMVDDNGIYRLEDQDRKSAYQNQIRPFKEARKIAAYKALYNIAKMLYAEQDADWLADTNRLKIEEMLLWKMEDFRVTRSLQTWHTFTALSGQMDYVLNKYILPAIGETKYDELVALVADPESEPSADDKLLKCIRAVLAHYSIIEAANEVNFKLTNNGIQVMELEAFANSNATVRNMNAQEKSSLIRHSQKRGDEAMCCIREIINPTDTDTEEIEGSSKVVIL